MLNWIFKFLLGDDIFISYSRADGATYAAGLANELAKSKFSCKIDQWGTESGAEMPNSLKKSLKRSAVLVLIGTNGAARSTHVASEIEEFKKTGRMIVPIIFGGVFLKGGVMAQDGNLIKRENDLNPSAAAEMEALWANEIEGLPISCERRKNLKTGNPAPEIVSRIEKTFTFSRKDERLKKTSFAVAALLLLLIAASAVAFGTAVIKGNEAARKTAEAAEATQTANIAKQSAEEQQKLADAAKKDADEQKRIAGEEKAKAVEEKEKADKASELATEKTKLAEEKTKLAKEKTEIADKETKRATAATQKAEQAEIKFTQSQNNLAENYYNISQTSSLSEPIQAIPWAQKAIETAPDVDIYKLWALNLTNNIPKIIINPPGGIGRKITYSPANDKAATVSVAERLIVWNLKTGEQLPNPLTNCSCKIVDVWVDDPAIKGSKISGGNPIFSPDGKLLAALSDEFSNSTNDSGKNRHLRVWNAETGAELLNKQDDRFRDHFIDNFAFSPNSREIMIDNSNETLMEILHWDIASGNELQPIYSSRISLKSDDGNPRAAQYTLPLSQNPERNWMMTFEENEAARVAVVRDISTGEKIGHEMLLPKLVEYINFSGAAGRIVVVFHEEGKDNKSNERMISAFDIKSGESIKPTRFATSINQEFDKILAFSKDDNKLIVDCKHVTLDIWGLNERGLVKGYDFMSARQNLSAFFSDDEKLIITVEDSPGSPPSSPQQIVRIFDTTNGNSGGYYPDLNGQVKVSTAADTFYRDIQGVILAHDFKKNAEESSTETGGTKLSLNAGDCLIKAYRTPDGKAILGVYHNPCPSAASRESRVNIKMQLWNFSTGKTLWSPEGVILGTTLGRSRIGNLDEVVFDSAGNRFVTIFQEDTSFYDNSEPESTLTVWETASGKPPENFKPVKGYLGAASFDDSSLITVEATEARRWRIQYRNPLTGDPNNSPIEFDKKTDGVFKALVGEGDYIISVPYTGENARDFNVIRIQSLSAGQKAYKDFYFEDFQSAVFAIQILRKVKNIALQNDASLKAELNPNLSIVISETGVLSLISKNGATSQLLAPRYSPGFDKLKISSDGRLILKTSSISISLWDSKTARSLIENIGFPGVFSELSSSNERVLTISAEGDMRSRVIISSTSKPSLWLSGMSEALGGVKIINDVNVGLIPQKDYLDRRREYLEKLKNAADMGNNEAKFILKNWNP